jgi:hypothetical protein
MRVLVLLCLFLLPGFALAEEPTITVTVGDQTRTFTRGELPGAARCHYHPSGAGHHLSRAHDLPCRASRGPIRTNDSSARQLIEAIALDGFIAQLPLDLVLNSDESKAVAWLAIDPADHPWPPVPEKDSSAGPLYIVWTGAEVGSIRSEQWPFQMA